MAIEFYKMNNILSIEPTKDYFMICWHMTGWCNYHCHYCIAEHLRTKWIDENVIIKRAINLNNFINKNIDKNRKIVYKLSGGEVTYYNLPKILDNIQRLDKVIVATNLSQKLDYYYELEDYCFKRNIQLVLLCSWHDENKNFENKFIELTNWCRSKPKQKFNYKDPQATIVVTKNFDKTKLNKLLDNNLWRIRLTRERDANQKNVSLSNEMLDYVYEYNRLYDSKAITNEKSFCYKVTYSNGEQKFACASNLTNFLDSSGFIPDGYYCTAGIDSIAVLPNGNISLARCDYLINNILGSIDNYENIQLPKDGIICHLNGNSSEKNKRCDLCAGTRLFKNRS